LFDKFNNNIFLLFLLSAIWGSSFFAIKISVTSINPISVACLRLTIAAIVLSIFFFYKGYTFKYPIRIYISIFYIALIGNFLPFFLISWSEVYIDSNVAGLLLSVAPIFAIIFSHFLTADDKFNFMKLIAVILGLIGIIFLLGFNSLKNIFIGSDYMLLAKFAVILAAFGYVISSIYAYNLKNINIITLTTIVTIFASLMSMPFMIIYEMYNFSIPSMNSILAVFYLGIFPTALAYLLRFHIISRYGPVFLSYVAYLIPIFAIFWGVVLLNEKINYNSIVGIFFVFLGIYFGQKGSNAKHN
tara:strand:+ start:4236 stop:5138 length:903 start_codon:yes stop_codon:yes gene_type:complete